MVLALTQTAIGGILLFISIVIAIAYALINARSSRAEIGSELDLAPNLKPYYDDEELEGAKLNRTLTFGLLGIFVIAVTLPLYWLAESGRQEGAVENFNRIFESRGEALFAANCAQCHGGVAAIGSSVSFSITDANGQFVKQVNWLAPALDTVLLRYSREEVRYILDYGRPFSPMPPWSTVGGGPMTFQQIQNLIDYLESIQLTPEESQAQVTAKLAEMRAMRKLMPGDDPGNPTGPLLYPPSVSDGELLFNLGYDDGFAGGAYACGRCHTTGWSFGEKTADGDGAFGPALRGGATLQRFPGAIQGRTTMVDFVCVGSQQGVAYGQNGQGTGRMPGFCQTPAERSNPGATGEVGVTERDASDPATEGGMLSLEQVEAIVDYERGL